jgi:hypothetical protein
MKLNLTSKLLAGALVLAASGSVFANTNLADGQTGNSSIFLNVVDLTAGTDYVLDLSAIDASNHFNTFNAAGAQSISLANDANWTAFKATTGSDEVQYNVIGANTIGQTPGNGALITSTAPTGTSSGSVGFTTNAQIRNNSVDNYIHAVNGSTTASTQSLFVTTSGATANPDAYFGTVFQLASGFPNTLADVGTAQTFYRLTAVPGLNLNKAGVTTYGTWNLIGDTLTYSPIPTPLPMPVTLLLSGLALMGIISRRGKSSTDVSFSGAAA